MWIILALALACDDDTSPGVDDSGSTSVSDTDTGTSSVEAVDPLDLAAELDADLLESHIQALQDLGTRYTIGSGDDDALAWLENQVAALGLISEQDPFVVNSETAANLIVRHDGVVDPDIVWIYSAHYDSTSNRSSTDAPGADDNASGVAAVLEAARILKDVPLAHSVWFVFTAAEEQGSKGSEHMVSWLGSEPVEVRGVIAPDMIGYWPLGDYDAFDILGDDDSVWLVETMEAVADLLGVPNKTWIEHGYCYGDDHTNFQEAGFPSISPMDCVEAHNLPLAGEETPHYHRTSDTLDTLHMPFTTRVAGVIVATLATLAEPQPQ